MNPNDPRANRSRRKLLDSGIALLLQRPDSSLSDIAAHAGVGRATLYRHFETREQLVQALARESLEMTEQAMAPIAERGLSGLAAIEAMLALIMPLADRYHFLLSLWNIAAEDETVTAIYEQQLAVLANWVAQGKKSGDIRRQLDDDWLVCSIDANIYAGWWMIQAGRSPEWAAEQATLTLVQGVGADRR